MAKAHLIPELFDHILIVNETFFFLFFLINLSLDIFVVVRVHKKTKGSTSYRIAISTKPGIEPFGPFLPSPSVFEKNQYFREFLFAKCKFTIF